MIPTLAGSSFFQAQMMITCDTNPCWVQFLSSTDDDNMWYQPLLGLVSFLTVIKAQTMITCDTNPCWVQFLSYSVGSKGAAPLPAVYSGESVYICRWFPWPTMTNHCWHSGFLHVYCNIKLILILWKLLDKWHNKLLEHTFIHCII